MTFSSDGMISVRRVELGHGTHMGPYHANLTPGQKSLGKYLMDVHSSYATHPSWQQDEWSTLEGEALPYYRDFFAERLDGTEGIDGTKIVSGFIDYDQYLNWFDPEIRYELQEEDFLVVGYRVPRADVILSSRQLIFDRSNASVTTIDPPTALTPFLF